MATLTITVDNAIVPRVLEAYGASTNAMLKAMIIAEIKDKVRTYELKAVKEAQAVARDTAYLQAINTATSTIDSEIIVS
jgi:hypothetical protein